MAARDAGDAALAADVLPGVDAGAEDPDADPASGDGLLLSFHEEIVDELLERDGLTVMAEGLGLSETLAGIIRALPRASTPPKASDSALATLLLPSTDATDATRHASGASASTSKPGGCAGFSHTPARQMSSVQSFSSLEQGVPSENTVQVVVDCAGSQVSHSLNGLGSPAS